MWSSWYQSEPGPSTVENRAQTECSTLLAQLARHRAVGQRDRLAVGELEGANVERVGAAVFGELGADDAVAAAAFERVEIVEIADGAAEARRQRRDVGADPVGDRGRHRAAQDRRRLHRDPPLVRQHDRLQPHQILAAAAAGAVDVGNAGRNRDLLGQRQPAGRGRRRRRARPARPACPSRRAPAFPPRAFRARPQGLRPDAASAAAPPRGARPGAASGCAPRTGRPRALAARRRAFARPPRARLAYKAPAAPPRR